MIRCCVHVSALSYLSFFSVGLNQAAQEPNPNDWVCLKPVFSTGNVENVVDCLIATSVENNGAMSAD